MPTAPPPWPARGRQHRPGPSLGATGPVSFRTSDSAARARGGGSRLGVVEQVHDAGHRPVETSRIDQCVAAQRHRRLAPLRSARDRPVPSGRRTAAVWCGSIVKRPGLAPPSCVKAMPGPDPPRHATPRCLHPPDAALKQRPAARSPPRRRPPVVVALLRPPVAEPDAPTAQRQPRRQLVVVCRDSPRIKAGCARRRPCVGTAPRLTGSPAHRLTGRSEHDRPRPERFRFARR